VTIVGFRLSVRFRRREDTYLAYVAIQKGLLPVFFTTDNRQVLIQCLASAKTQSIIFLTAYHCKTIRRTSSTRVIDGNLTRDLRNMWGLNIVPQNVYMECKEVRRRRWLLQTRATMQIMVHQRFACANTHAPPIRNEVFLFLQRERYNWWKRKLIYDWSSLAYTGWAKWRKAIQCNQQPYAAIFRLNIRLLSPCGAPDLMRESLVRASQSLRLVLNALQRPTIFCSTSDYFLYSCSRYQTLMVIKRKVP
jgi:hypothetical protein